jgi:hypothetical protein
VTDHPEADRTGVQPPDPNGTDGTPADVGLTDDELIDVLRQVFDAVDAPPEHVVAQAREAYAWHNVDVELAELVYDSATNGMAGVRAAEAPRQVTFRAPGLEIEVEVVSERTRIVIGQLVPAQEATVELRHGGRREEATADALGRFSFDDVAAGPIKLTVVAASGATVQTEGLVV